MCCLGGFQLAVSAEILWPSLCLQAAFVYPCQDEALKSWGDTAGCQEALCSLSCDFHFGTHKGQSQTPPAVNDKTRVGQLGSPASWVPLNREARTSNPSSTGVDINSRLSPKALLSGIPVSPKMERNTTSHSSFGPARSPSPPSLSQWKSVANS